MANYPNYNLYGKRPADTFRNIVQFNITASNLVDSYGDELPPISISASVSGTASWANNAINSVSASWAPDQTVTVNSASWASQSLSASWAPFTDTGTTLVTASTYQITASSAISASWAPSAAQVEQISASWASASLSASYAPFTQVEQVSASWASQSLSASWAPGDGSGTLLTTGSTYQITSSNAVSASWAPFTQVEQISASWASASLSAKTATTSTSSLSASWVDILNQEVDIEGPQGLGDTTPYTSLKVVGREGWPVRILQGGSFVTQSARPVLYVYRDLDQSQAQITPLLQLRTYETGSLAPLMVASNDVSDVFTIDYSGSITASGLFGTASNAVSASWAPTSITYPLTTLAVNNVSYSIDFAAGQYFQVDTTASQFTFGNSTNAVAVRNASIYITAQSGSRTIVFHPSWIVMGNFPTTIAHNSASVLSLTTFGSNDASVVAAFASKV